MDINYRAALEVTRHGELQIQLPENLTSSRQPFPPLPNRAQKEISARFEKLQKVQHDIVGNISGKNRLLLVVNIEYHLKGPLRNWGGWSMNLQNCSHPTKKDATLVTQCWTRHGGDPSLFSADGVRTWLPCIDDPSRQSIFDLSITIPTYCKSISDSERGRSEKYRVMCSGILVSSAPSVSHSNMTTYRFITPHRIPAYSLGVYIGVVKETFTTPLYQVQGHVWIAKYRAPCPSDDVLFLQSTEPIEDSHLSERVVHTLLGLDGAVRHVHKAIQRVFPYSRCTIIFVPELDSDFLSFDGFFLINSNWLLMESFIYLETPAHLLILQAYLSSWFKGALLMESFSAEFLLFGAIGFLIDEYVEHVFGAEESRYRFLKQYNSVIDYEKASASTPLALPFPEEYSRFSEFHLKYLQYKSTVIFHIICHRAGGHMEIILKAVKNIIKTREIQKGSRQSGEGPPPTPSHDGFMVPLMPGTPWYSPPSTPMFSVTSPPPSYPGTPIYAMPLSPHHGLERKRSDSISSTGEGEIPEEVSLTWKLDPTDPLEMAASSFYQRKDSLVEAFPPPPPVATHALSSNLDLPSSLILEEALWGTDFRGGNSSAILFLADVKDISGGVATDLNDSFIDQFITHHGCMFLRAGVSVSTKHKKVDIALHQVGFRSGIVDSARFSYKDKVPIHVVEAEVWQYSRKVDGKAQIVTFNLHTKPRRQGGRRKVVNAEELAVGAAQGPTVETLSLADEIHTNTLSLMSSESSRSGPLKYLCSPADVVGGRVQAQALAAVRAGSLNGAGSAGSASQSVQFVGIDPEVHWIREVHLNSPDDLLIEQLYADLDIIGQITALKALAQFHISPQTIPTQILRLRAIKDVLMTGTNDGNVVHSLCVRMEAIYALAEWQNAHAPIHPRAKNDASSSYTWAALDILLGCLRGMFTDISKSSQLEFGDRFLPVPNDFSDHAKTQLRSALIVALASIKSSNGETPQEIIEELLNFAENNDNNPDLIKEENVSGGSNNPTSLCYDDGHYCSILLYALSKISCNPASPNAPHLLRRVVEVSKYYLHRESILTAAQTFEEEGNAGSGINKARGFYKAGDERFQKRSGITASVGRGLVTAMALQCICNAEIQLDTSSSGNLGLVSVIENFNFRMYFIDHTNPLSVPPFSELVRASALDCCLRLAFAKQIARLLNQTTEVTSPTSKDNDSRCRQSDGAPSVKKNQSSSEIINLTLSVIQHDPSREVRRCAALSLLYALQDRESYIPYKILSLSEPLSTYNWSDASGLVILGNDQIRQRKFSSEHRQVINKVTTKCMRTSLKKLWNFISSNPVTVYDQVIRCSLLYCWLYTFYSRKEGKQQIPKSLVLSHTSSASSSCLEPSIENPQNSFTAVVQLSFRDRFPHLPYSGPLIVRDPVESCCDLEEAMRVGSYGIQISRADPNRLHETGKNPNVLRLSRKGGEESHSASHINAKRRVDDNHNSNAVKRPRLVKFVL